MTDHSHPMLFTQSDIDAAAPSAVGQRAEGPTAAADSVRVVRNPRINRPERCQGEMRMESLDARLDADHEARVVWNIVEGLDLSSLYQQIDAVEGVAGRNASDPRVLFVRPVAVRGRR
jgi:hypothetical protein